MTELVLNPNLRIEPVLRNGRLTAYALTALVRGRGRLQRTVEIARARPEVIDVLERMVNDAEVEIEVDEAACAPLVDLGVLVHDHEISRSVRLSCRLDAGSEPAAALLTVNSDIAITGFAEFAAQQPGLEHSLESCAQIVVVADPVTGAHLPYWLDDRERRVLQRLVPGAPPPADLDPADLNRLAGADILVAELTAAAGRRRMRGAAAQLAQHGYAVLPSLLPRLQIAALRRYYRSLIEEGHVADHDSQVERRFAQHNERLMRYYHHQLCSVFAGVAGRPLKPSYGYLSSYRRGARLKKHVDRAQCEFTASLLIDYARGPSDDPAWPLYLELPATGERIAIDLEPGGAVLYRGCELPHYRDELHGEYSTSLFLHYVDEAFSDELE
jgi:hypothetical protein